ncbi:hypothetical protein ABZU75_31915 [Streptosporangium sp. NPDC005286]|uniref:hypothetical protein n=1 Tax=Streptosporangium sp. NPDC005286 TaxID=3154463 RepID=UPI0033BDDBA4
MLLITVRLPPDATLARAERHLGPPEKENPRIEPYGPRPAFRPGAAAQAAEPRLTRQDPGAPRGEPRSMKKSWTPGSGVLVPDARAPGLT